MGVNFPLKVVTITFKIGVSSEQCDVNSKQSIADYLNNKLLNNPEFFGDFTAQDIIEVKDIEAQQET